MAKLDSRSGLKAKNPAMQSRVSYLYQVATYLESRKRPLSENAKNTIEGTFSKSLAESHDSTTQQVQSPNSNNALRGSSLALPRKLLSDLRSVSHKAQLRLSPAMKNSICKRCNALLIHGSTCSSEIENKSKGGKKPWADVLVRKCNSCAYEKRFPVAVERQTFILAQTEWHQSGIPEMCDTVQAVFEQHLESKLDLSLASDKTAPNSQILQL